MKLKILKELITTIYEVHGAEVADELVVRIPNQRPSIGRTSSTEVVAVQKGIDRDKDSFFILPEVEMIELRTGPVTFVKKTK